MTYQQTRRTLFVGAGAAAAAALLPMQQAVAQAAAEKGDWMAMIKSHHALIAKTFDELLAADPKKGPPAALVKKLAYQLTAHSVAEENVLYAAMSAQGMKSESDKLYLDQAHAKVMNHQVDMLSKMKDPKWQEAAKSLQAAVLKHAKEDEEGNLYPKMQQKLDPKMNAMLTAEYQRHFSSVKQA
jgi:hemerythrin superfamily protein